MKKIAALVAIILIPLLSYSIITPDVMSYVSKNVTYPASAKISKIEGVVLVQFTVKENGQIELLQINSNNPFLMQYVMQRLDEIIIPSSLVQPQIYSMKFNFRLL